MNTFGGPLAGTSRTVRYGLIDPRSVREDRSRFRRDVIPVLDRANSFYCPAGRWASRGWILLPKSEYDSFNEYSTEFQLDIGNTSNSDNVQTLKNLAVVHARCVTRGLTSDSNSIYLIELTDARGLLSNQWFQFPLTAQYNIRAPAYPQTFHPSSMNGSTTWTWSTMIQDIWTTMGTFLGTWPGLPFTPSSTPEGFWFPGVPAWPALCDVLDHLGMMVACDLTQDNPFTIVDSSASDTALATAQSRYATQLEDDLEWSDIGAARVPKTVIVLFRRRNSVYGTEETVTYRNDSMAQQWDMKAYYQVSISAPSTFSSAVGKHFLWSSFTVRYDDDSNPLSADVTTANNIAQELVTRYFAKIYGQTVGFMNQTYAGALPFATGPGVDGVAWMQDLSMPDRGWRTQVVYGATPPWPLLAE